MSEIQTAIMNVRENESADWQPVILLNDPAIRSDIDHAVDTATAAQVTAQSKASITYLTATLYADAWEDGEQTITNAGIPAPDGTGGSITPPQDISMDALTAYEAARPWAYGQQAGSIIVRARGTVPTVDIPIVMEVRQ